MYRKKIWVFVDAERGSDKKKDAEAAAVKDAAVGGGHTGLRSCASGQ